MMPKVLVLNLGVTTLLPLFALGVVFALIYYLGKSVHYPTITHILYNIFAG
jgi:membrane protease YdiL (CAAX protease family)